MGPPAKIEKTIAMREAETGCVDQAEMSERDVVR